MGHCLAGNSLLLTGLPGTGKTRLARTIVARLRAGRGGAQNLGLGAQTADHWVRRYVRGGSAQKLDWLVVEEITQLDMALWADLACVGLNADVKFLLLGDFRQLPAVLGRAAHQRAVGAASSSATWPAGTGTSSREHASDPGIFNFVTWLRVGEEACPTSKPGWPDTTLVISHSKRMAAAANRALAPEASKLLELEVIHLDLGKNGCDKCITQNSPQSMRCGRGFFAAEEPGAAAGHPAEPRSYLRQLPGAHPPQPRPPGPGVLPPHATPPARGRLTGQGL